MSTVKTTIICGLLTLSTLLTAQEETTIPFKISDYGLIFTEVSINGEMVNAMIDFGQPHLLMLSSSLIKKQGIKAEKSDKVGYNIDGEELPFYEGTANQLQVQGLSLSSVDFTSSPNEMESVSAQIGTRFDAALGWGFFSQYFFTLNYSKTEITLTEKAAPIAGSFTVPYDKAGSYMMLKVGLDEQEGQLIIDTGAPVSTLHDGFIKGKTPVDNAWGQPSLLLNTQIGTEKLELAFELRDLSVLESLKVVGILGGDLLQQYVISIDPDKQTMYWKPLG